MPSQARTWTMVCVVGVTTRGAPFSGSLCGYSANVHEWATNAARVPASTEKVFTEKVDT